MIPIPKGVRRAPAFACALFVSVLARQAEAQQAAPPDQQQQAGDKKETAQPASLPDLVMEALARNPEIAAARRRLEARRARIPQAGALPDPMAMAGVMNEGRPIPFETLGEAGFSEAYVGVSQEIPFPGKRGLREAVAREEAAAEEWALEATRRRVAADVAEAFHEIHAVQAALEVLGQSRVVLDQLAGVAASRFGVGQGTQQDVFDAEVELSMLEERQALLAQRRETLEAQLASLLDQPGLTMVLAAPPPRAAAPAALDALLVRAEATSALLNERKAVLAQAERKLALARRDRLPDLGVEFVYHNRGGLDPYWTFGGTVTLPIYAGRKQDKAVEEAVAEQAAAAHALAAARNRVRYEVRQAYLAAAAAERVVRLYEQALLKQAELSLESATAQYRVGKVDFQTLVTAWRRLLDQRAALHEQLATYEKALARLAVHTSPAAGPWGIGEEN